MAKMQEGMGDEHRPAASAPFAASDSSVRSVRLTARCIPESAVFVLGVALEHTNNSVAGI